MFNEILEILEDFDTRYKEKMYGLYAGFFWESYQSFKLVGFSDEQAFELCKTAGNMLKAQ